MTAALLGALGFLTIVGGSRPLDRRSLGAFGVIGALVGASLAAVALGARELWDPVVVATLVVATDVVLTGALHVDGLADAADGLGPPVERDRRLAIMRTPDVGAFGTVAVVLVLLTRTATLAAIVATGSTAVVAVLVATWTASRSGMVLTMAAGPPARTDGLGHGLRPDRTSTVQAGATLAAVAVAGSIASAAAGLAVVGTVAGAAVVDVRARRALGGYTGDTIGAGAVIGETVGLLVAAAVLG